MSASHLDLLLRDQRIATLIATLARLTEMLEEQRASPAAHAPQR